MELAPLLKRCQFCFQLYSFVVVEVDVIVNNLLGLLEGEKLGLVNGFFFEMPKEVLHGSIVEAVSGSRHGDRDELILSEQEILMRAIGGSLVAVEGQVRRNGMMLEGLAKCGCHQFHRIIGTGLVRDNEAII